MSELTNEVVNAVCRQDFPTFVQKAFKGLHPHEPFDDNWHIPAVANLLQQVGAGEILRQMFLMPPRSMKSLLCSVMFPVWFIGNNPGKTVIVASHNKDLAKDLSNKSRKLMMDPFVQNLFPALKTLTKDTETEFTTSAGGGRIAISVDGGVTGRGGHLLILDDVLDASDADNEAACERVNLWIDEVFSTRMNQPAKTPILCVMQRLSVFDPVDHLRSQEHWSVLSLPAIATEEEEIPIGGGEVHR